MLVSFTFRISMECSACKMSLPVNGVAPSLRCYHCGEVNVLDATWWQFVIEKEHLAEALGYAEGEAQESRVMSKRGNYTYARGKRVPRCQACKGPDLSPEAMVAEADDGKAFCPGCGAMIRVRVADDLCRAIHPGAKVVVAESIADAAGQAVQAQRQPVIFACMGCAGALRVDGSSRSVTCQYCNAANYLPDGLWNQLNPVPKPHAWFLIVDFDQRQLRDLRWSSDDARAADAAGGAFAPDEFALLAGDKEYEVRRATAQNPACPPAVLEQLSHDRDSDVLAAVAGNPATPLEALLRLMAADTDKIRTALLGNPSQHTVIIDQLATSSHYSVRRAVAGHPSVPLATLHQLAKDHDSEVKTAARARLDELKAQGVDVDAGRGFFSKLFG